MAMYLCPAYPDKGSLVLFLKCGSIRPVHTLKTLANRFPFLEELRKRVPHALQFAPANEADALADDCEDEAASAIVLPDSPLDPIAPAPAAPEVTCLI